MNKSSTLNAFLEDLSKQDENQYCFDCNKIPAPWASVNNSIFLCLKCSGEHRGFGVSVSYIRSITLDTWNNNQVEMMRIGGNKKLKEFLGFCGIGQGIDKKTLYSSKLMNYYRKMLKAQSVSENLNLDLPPRSEMLEPYQGQGNIENNTRINRNTDDLSNKKISLYDDPNEKRNKFSGLSNNQSQDNSRIGENHYIQSGNKSYDFPEEANNYNNYVASNADSRVSSVSRNNDPRFTSVSSSNVDYYEDESHSRDLGSKVYSILGGALNVTKNVASSVKEKVKDLELGDKLYYAGGKTADILYNASYKVYEKGSEIAKSDTVASIAETAKTGITSGFGFLYGKIFGSSEPSGNANNPNQVSSENYNKNNNYNNEPVQYVKMDENLNQKFLDK